MKTYLLALVLLGCGANNTTSSQQTRQPYYSMTWNCGNNARCAKDMGKWYGSGSFQVESDCLAWETAFINNYSGSSVTACTYNQ